MSSAATSPERGALRVARQIAQRVYDERIPAGTKLASESESLAEYAVSRGTLREALRFLQIHGAIELRTGPNGGQFVGNPRWQDLASTIALLLQFANATIETVVEARLHIEPGMASLAARNATDEDIARMSVLLDEVERRVEDYEAFYELYLQFWDALASSSRNPLFGFLSPALRRITWTAGIRPNQEQREGALGQLRVIHAAIARHDEARARREMQRLEEGYLETMRSEYPRELHRVVSWADAIP
jgi:GntR family transcriptional repressor for pyruvate dehydrogenase complex